MSRRRTCDPRLVAAVAFVLGAVAIALEIAYMVGHFVLATIGRIHA